MIDAHDSEASTMQDKGSTEAPAASKARPNPKPRAVPKPAASAPAPEATEVNGATEVLELYLLRHADAGDATTWEGDDSVRPLSPKGRRQARRLAGLLAEVGWRPDQILTSPKVRAADTAKFIGKAVRAKATTDDRLAGGLDLQGLRDIVGERAGIRRLVLVGHDPDFSDLASALSGAAIELPKGALVRIDLADRSVAAGSGALRWLIPPGATPD